MGRKVRLLFCCFALIAALSATAQAATHEVYEGSFNSTYVNYFRDIVSGLPFTDHYVAFRSGDSSYTMVSGNLQYENGLFKLNETGKAYVYSAANSGYSSVYYYTVTSINTFELSADNHIIYSDLGDFPELTERGAKYEMLNTLLLVIALLGLVVGRIFRNS